MAHLDERKQQILTAVVHSYVRTAEPVASEQILKLVSLPVKSATIRNEMAAMADLGYLRQPHTSAGRIPSDLGYRFFVDRLMEPSPVPESLAQQTRSLDRKVHTVIDELLSETCHILSGMTRLTSLATTPTADDISLSWYDMRPVGAGQVMVLALWSNSELRHCLLSAPDLSGQDYEQIGNVVGKCLIGKSASQISDAVLPSPAVVSGSAYTFLASLQELLVGMAKGARVPEVLVDSPSHLMRQPEFHEGDSLEYVLSVLEDRQTIVRLLEGVSAGSRAQVVIGHENPIEPLRNCSVVAAAYSPKRGVRGAIGVFGPTRMDYAGIVSAVEFVAQSLSRTLAGLFAS